MRGAKAVSRHLIRYLLFGCLTAVGFWSAASFLLNYYALSGSPQRVKEISIGFGGVTHLLKGAVGATRTWQVEKPAEATISFAARLDEQTAAPRWELAPSIESPAGTARKLALSPDGKLMLEGPSNEVARYLIVLGAPLAGRHFRASFDVEPGGDDTPVVGTVALSSQDGRDKSSTNFRVTEAEALVSTWSAPPNLDGYVLVVTLSNLGGYGSIGSPAIQEQLDGSWAQPTLATIAIDAQAHKQAIVVDGEWNVYRTEGIWLDGKQLSARLTLGSGNRVLIRDFNATETKSDHALRILPTKSRVSLLGIHPNLLAHSVVSVFGALLFIGGPLWLSVASTVLAFVALGMFGSRIALIAAAIALMYFGTISWRRHKVAIFFSLVSISLVAVVAIGFASSFQREPEVGVVSRPEIWRVAWQGFTANFPNGIQTSFSDYWADKAPTRPPISHAHNFWLQLSVKYGLLGLLGSVALTVALGIFAWRRYRWRGLGLLLPLYLLNVFDYSFSFVGVYVPLALALWIGKRRS
ncbi:MAG: O-antigen ligase family protein [Truepera sp.]|jgi:hypothetical protein|nr:O-antigen ligase family protein [Truepera sp.]